MQTENTTYVALNLNLQELKSTRRALGQVKARQHSARNVAEYRALENRLDRMINAIPVESTEWTTPTVLACNVAEAKSIRRALWQQACASITAPTVVEYESIAKKVHAALS